MSFSNLSQRDKDAFFALLDEYFEARPGLFNGSKSPPITASNTGTTSIKSMPNSPPNPPSRSLSTTANGTSNTSLKPRAVPPAPGPPSIPSRTNTPRIVEPSEKDDSDVDEAPVSVSSRIAAAQAGIGNGYSGRAPVPSPRRVSTQSTQSNQSQHSPPPTSSRSPAPPRGLVTPGSNNNTPAPGGPSGLVSSRGIGSIDTSSGGSAVSSVFSFKGIGKNPPKPAFTPSNSAFEKPKTRETFAPPPRRGDSGSSPVPSSRQAPLPPQEVEMPEEEEAQGEWVEALYDLVAAEPTDLSFKAGEQIWVTERTSKDWWMAEIGGQAGLVPATYVKPL